MQTIASTNEHYTVLTRRISHRKWSKTKLMAWPGSAWLLLSFSPFSLWYLAAGTVLCTFFIGSGGCILLQNRNLSTRGYATLWREADCKGFGRQSKGGFTKVKMGPTTTSKRKFLLRLIWLQNPGERERVRVWGVGTQLRIREFLIHHVSDTWHTW